MLSPSSASSKKQQAPPAAQSQRGRSFSTVPAASAPAAAPRAAIEMPARPTSLAHAIESYIFPAQEEQLLHRALNAVHGPPVRDPVALLNALARLDIALPFGLESLPLLATIAGLHWRRELFPLSGGDFRKIVAACAVGPIETSELPPELLRFAEECLDRFPAQYGQCKSLMFLRGQAAGTPMPIVDESDDGDGDGDDDARSSASPADGGVNQQNTSASSGVDPSGALNFSGVSTVMHGGDVTGNTTSTSVGLLNRTRSVRFIGGAMPLHSPMTQTQEPSSSSSSSSDDNDDDAHDRDQRQSASFSASGSASSRELREELYRRTHGDREETEQVLRDLFLVPRPAQRKRRTSTNDAREQQPQSPDGGASSSPTAVCFSADKVGTFFEKFELNPRGMLRFFENSDQLEETVKQAHSAASIRRIMRARSSGGGGASGGDASEDALGAMNRSTTSPAALTDATPTRKLSSMFGPHVEQSSLSDDNNAVAAALQRSAPPAAMSDFPTSFPPASVSSSSAAATGLGGRRQSFAFGDTLSSVGAKTSTKNSKIKNPANAVFDVEMDGLSAWLAARPSSNEGYNTPRTAERVRTRWRVSVFAVLQTVRASSKGLDGNASAMDLMSGEGDGGLAGFAQRLFQFQRDNKLESTALQQRLGEIEKEFAAAHKPFERVKELPLLPQLGNVDGVIAQMGSDRRSVEMMLRRMCVPAYGDSGVAEVAKRIVNHRVHRGATDQSLVVRVPTREESSAIRDRLRSRAGTGCGAHAAGVRAAMHRDLHHKADVVDRLLSRPRKGDDARRKSLAERTAEEQLRREEKAERARQRAEQQQQQLVFFRRPSVVVSAATPQPTTTATRRPGSALQRDERPASAAATMPRRRPVSALRRAVAAALAPISPQNPNADAKPKRSKRDKRAAKKKQPEKEPTANNTAAAAATSNPPQRSKDDDDDTMSTVSSYSVSSSSSSSPSASSVSSSRSDRSAPAASRPPRNPPQSGLPPKAPRSLDSSVAPAALPGADDTLRGSDLSSTMPGSPPPPAPLSLAMQRWIGSVDPITALTPPPTASATTTAVAVAAASPGDARSLHSRPGTAGSLSATQRRQQQHHQQSRSRPLPTDEELRHVVPAAHDHRASPAGSLEASFRSTGPRRDSPPRLSPREDFGDRPCRTRAKLEGVLAESRSGPDADLGAVPVRESEQKRLAHENELQRTMLMEIASSRSSVIKRIGSAKIGDVSSMYSAHIVRRKL